MKEREARELLKDLFERHSVPAIPVKFYPKPITTTTTKEDISKRLEDVGLGHMADAVTVRHTIYGAFIVNPVTRERWIEFYGLPSPRMVRHEFRHYLELLGVDYIRKSPTTPKEAEG